MHWFCNRGAGFDSSQGSFTLHARWAGYARGGEAAPSDFAERAARGDRCYVEGQLGLNTWQTSDGEKRTGINLAAWKCEKVGASAIGRNRQFREKGHAIAADSFRQPGESQAERQLRAASFEAEPYRREKPKVMGRDDFNDPLPW